MFNNQIQITMPSTLFTETELNAVDFIERCNMRRTESLILGLKSLTNPLFVQLRGEYYDVWHSVVRIRVNSESPRWSYCVFIDQYGKEKMEYFHRLSKFCAELPSDTRILHTI